MAKAAEHCIEKLVKGSGLDDALVETKVFGEKVLEQALSGNHYELSLRGYLILEDAIEIMKWKAFMEKCDESVREALLMHLCHKILIKSVSCMETLSHLWPS